jgi:hypothetical protein
LSATITPIGSSGYRHITIYPAIIGEDKVYYNFRQRASGNMRVLNFAKNNYRLLLLTLGALVINQAQLSDNTRRLQDTLWFFVKSLREHVSAAIDKNLHTKLFPSSLRNMRGNNPSYERLTPVHRITKLNKRMVPSSTRELSPLQTYVQPGKYICDYCRVVERAN